MIGRMRRLVVPLLVIAIVAGGCSKDDNDQDRVIRFIDATTTKPHRFSYEVEGPGLDPVAVQGLIEDDFTRKLQLSIGGKPMVEQVIVDDAVAMRFFDPGLVDGFVDRNLGGEVDESTNIEGATVTDALKAQRWVLDDAGAPSAVVDLREESGKGEQPARDPLFEARTALAAVRRIAQAGFFAKYDPESINPTYRSDEDPFPKPQEGSGVDRYDVVQPKFPTAAQAVSGSIPTLPSPANFRKMAVYVKDGVVIAVREFVGVSPRELEDFAEYTDALVSQTAPDDVVAAFRAQVKKLRGDEEALAAFLLNGLNTFVENAGREQIRFRTVSLQLQDVGSVEQEVALPGDAITGSLAMLRNVGRKPVAAATEAARPAVPQSSSTASAGETTSTTAG